MIFRDTDTIDYLFRLFPREYLSSREKVNNKEELLYLINLHNGMSNVFVSLYDFSFTIDKLWWDLDAPSIEKCRVEARRQEDRLTELGIPYLAVFTANKGFHFYVPTDDYKPKSIEEGNRVLKGIIRFLTSGIKYIDRISQNRQLVRIPNTIHPKTGAYCIYVDLKTFTIEDSRKPSKFPGIKERMDIVDLYKISGFGKNLPVEDQQITRTATGHSIPADVEQFLKPLIRPCVYEILKNDSNPIMEIREEIVKELHWLGYKVESILTTLSRFNWDDWDEDLTRYHILKIVNKELIPRTCDNMHPYVKCTKCGFNYYWDEF